MSVDRVLAPTGHRVRKIEGQVFAAVLFLDIDGVLHPVNAEEDEFFGGIADGAAASHCRGLRRTGGAVLHMAPVAGAHAPGDRTP